jgi:hypothetical protein
MAQVEKLQAVLKALRDRAAKAERGQASVVVGYSTKYAVYVHEDLEAAHGEAYNQKYADQIAARLAGFHSRGTNQQAKFLEAPARYLKKELGEIFLRAMRRGVTMAQALLLVGLRLQRESMKLVPVDTGSLKASAFTRLDRGG